MEIKHKPIAAFLVHWLGETGEKTKEIMQKEHFLASMRIRINPAIEAVKLLGLEPKMFVFRTEHPEDLDLLIKAKPVIAIIGKLNHPQNEYFKRIRMANLAAITLLKNANVPIVLDYSDNHAEGIEPKRSFWKLLLKECNHIVVPTKAMKEQLGKELQSKIIIIKDPLEGPAGKVSGNCIKSLCQSSKGLNLLWFGHSTNLIYLSPWLELLRSYKWPLKINLRVLTRLDALKTITKWIQEQPEPKSAWEHIPIKYKRQSDVFRTLEQSHIVLVPSTLHPKDFRKKAASHNRVSESLHAGRVVLAHSLPAYKELLPDEMLVNNDSQLNKKLLGLINNWGNAIEWVEKNQPLIKNTFSAEQIVATWAKELKLILNSREKLET